MCRRRQEAGFPELTFNGVNGIYGWRDMPESLKARIAADVREIAADPAVAARLQPTGATMRPGNAAEFAAAIEDQRAKVAAVAQAAGVKGGEIAGNRIPSRFVPVA